MAVADASIAHGKALEAQFINHAPCGSTGRVFEDAAGTFLAERLAGAPFFVADTNTLENFFVRFGGEFQNHREHHIIGGKTNWATVDRNLVAREEFDQGE